MAKVLRWHRTLTQIIRSETSLVFGHNTGRINLSVTMNLCVDLISLVFCSPWVQLYP